MGKLLSWSAAGLVLAATVSATAVTPIAAQPAPPAAPLPPQPLAMFAKGAEWERPRINQNATAIAARLRSGDRQALAIIPLDQPGAQAQIIARDGEFDKMDDVRTSNWSWIDPDNLLIWITAATDLDGERVEASRVLSYNRKTRQRTLLGWDGTFVRGSNVLWVSRDGPPRILLSRLSAANRRSERINNPEVIEVDVLTGKQRIIQNSRPGVTSWFADGNGNVRLGVSTDSHTGKLTALYRPDGSGDFRTIIRERQERYSLLPVPQIFLPGNKAIVMSRHEGTAAVYEMDLNTMQFGNKLFSDPKFDVEDVDPNEARNGVERIAIVRDRRESIWLDPRMKEIQAVLDESFGAGRATMVSADKPRQNILVHVGGPDQRGGYYLFNTETGSMRLLGWVNSAWKDARFNPVRTIRYKARDGKEISAVLTLPRSRPAKALPLIVLPHGGPWARDQEEWDMWAQPLAELGYAVVQPNFRGSSGYGRAWEAMSDGGWGTTMSDDLDDSITHLAQQGIADPKRVCIFGWSYGGYAAARAAQRNPDLYRCAIAGAGVYDIPKMIDYDRGYLGRYGSQYIGAAATRLADVSPARHTDGKWAPILIVHGAKDERVPVAQGRLLFERLKASGKVAGKDVVYVEQPRNTHHLPLESDRLQLLDEMAKFLRQHNPS